jgi:diguanylate cyclase (GGDEF)-like protein
MRQLILRLGRIRSIIATTAISTTLSNLFTLFLYVLFLKAGVDLNLKAAITIASVVSIIITPIIGWYMFGFIIEITELEQEMRKLATYDSLTGLLTRRTFIHEGEIIFNLAKRENLALSILIIDFDNFKKINDNYGHFTGDEVLRTFGNIVKNTIRKSDLAGRIGGEEFAILLSNSNVQQATCFVNRLQNAVRQAVVRDENGNEIFFSVSIGLADFPRNPVNGLESLYHLADGAMYEAKSNGRNTMVVYSCKTQNQTI